MRSRFWTFSMRTSTALLPRLAALIASVEPMPTIAMIPIAHFAFLPMCRSASAEGTSNRVFQRGERLVIFVDCVHAVDLRSLVLCARGADVEEGLGPHPIARLAQREILGCLGGDLGLELDCLRGRHEV